MGHVDHRCLEAMVQTGDLGAHLDAEICIQVAERFIEEEDFGLPDNGAAEGHSLALSARKRFGFSVEIGLDAQDLCRLVDARVNIRLAVLPEFQSEREILVDRHVGVEGVVLKDHGDVAIFRRDIVHDLAVDADGASRNIFEPGDHPEHGGFAAAGGADEDDELLVLNRDVDVPDGGHFAVVHFGDLLELHLSHGVPCCEIGGSLELKHAAVAALSDSNGFAGSLGNSVPCRTVKGCHSPRRGPAMEYIDRWNKTQGSSVLKKSA